MLETWGFCEVATVSRTLMLIEFNKDYAISIATIHHLATGERRRAAVEVHAILLRPATL
jgi:hypothetical protein